MVGKIQNKDKEKFWRVVVAATTLGATLPRKSIHSLSHLVTEIDYAFNHFDIKHLTKKF